MNANKVLISTLIGAVASFILGFLIYGFVLASFMKNNAGTPAGMIKENSEMVTIVIANLALAFLFSFIFARWAGIKLKNSFYTEGYISNIVLKMAFAKLLLLNDKPR